MRTAHRTRVYYAAAAAWLIFTMSLASWWLMVGLTITGRHRMFLWEGGAFIVVLLGGGIAILIAIRREDRRHQALEMFFMSFTHDLKTSLASVQLQAEGLREDHAGNPDTRVAIERLLEDVVRLQIQLENSLFVAQPDGRLLTEQLAVHAAIERQREDWPGLAIDVEGSALVSADARALDAVLRNILQNAVLHGQASHVAVTIRPDAGHVRITIEDDGRGVPADKLAHLGVAFTRSSDSTGTGVGLHVSRRLIHRMGGLITFAPGEGGRGLRVVIALPEAR